MSTTADTRPTAANSSYRDVPLHNRRMAGLLPAPLPAWSVLTRPGA